MPILLRAKKNKHHQKRSSKMPSLEIFHSIPEILSYFFPGFVSISIFLFLSSNKLEYSHINVYSICISYAIKVLIDSILYKFNLIRTTGLIYVIYLCFGVVSGCLVYCIYRNPKIKKHCQRSQTSRKIITYGMILLIINLAPALYCIHRSITTRTLLAL